MADQKKADRKKRADPLLAIKNTAEHGAYGSAPGTDWAADPEEPGADQFTVNIPQAVSPIDIDIIKTTAQFVARNGETFLTELTKREMRNPQFEFLKPTHFLFTLFTSLVDAYTKVLVPDPDFLAELQKVSDPDSGKATILEKGLKRYM